MAADPVAAPDDLWNAPPPAEYRPLLAQMRTQQEAGDYEFVVKTSLLLELTFAQLYGELHPYTVNMLSLRAWLTNQRGEDWADVVETFLATVERRRKAGAPATDTERMAVDAYRAWRKLTQDDPERALKTATALVEALDHDERRANAVITWSEERLRLPYPG
ncbi:hypothetical protein ACFV1L_22255 [Kitasatospora sp. NPDC059646]|uniref:hypothetical protein n=1 Tax=Kitasatospora sp. NPDC059646 TaxID=3346893 RepID=UPI00368705E3